MKNKKDIIIFLIIFIIMLIIFFPLIIGHFSTDTYNIINLGLEKYAITYSLNDGRPINALLLLACNALKMDVMNIVRITTVLAILISSITVMAIRKEIVNKKEPNNIWTEILITLISCFTIFNFTFLENMQYVECFVMSISILMYTLAAKQLVWKNSFLKAGILATIATLAYQGTIGWFITIVMLFSLIKEEKINKKVIINIFTAGVICVISVIINLIQIKICGMIFGLEQYRMGGFRAVFKNTAYIITKLYYIYTTTFNLFPKYMFMIILLIISYIYTVQEKNNSHYISYIALVFIGLTISFAPNLFTLSAFGTARMSFSIGALIGISLIYLYCNSNCFEKENIFKWILISITIFYALITSINYESIIIDHKKVNELDKQEALRIGEYLDDYEKNTSIELKEIKPFYDYKENFFYKNIKNKSSLCFRALSAEWSYLGVINYYNNRNLEGNLKIRDVVQDKDWNELNEEQLVFEGNTVYYYIY